MKQKKKPTTQELYPNMTTLWVEKKDKEWCEKTSKKMKKRGAGAVVSSMIELIKYNKMEGEMK